MAQLRSFFSRRTHIALGALALAGRQLTRRRRPYILNHLITVRCNMACPFCYVSGPEQQAYNRERYGKGGEMSTAEMRTFYQNLVSAGFKLAVIVGGEPLVRKDLGELLRVLRGQVYTSVFTNGLQLADRLELVEDASSLFVSVDAPDSQHDQLRDSPGSFDKALAGIEAVRRRLPKLRLALNMTVTSDNAHRVADMLALARDIDLPIAFQPPSYDGQFALDDRPVAKSAEKKPGSAQIATAFRRVDAAIKRGESVICSRAFVEHVIEDRPSYPCHYPTYVLGPVLPNGDVVGCVDSKVIDNVRDGDIERVVRAQPFVDNAAQGLGCPHGCRDWGIHDLSLVYNRRFSLPELGRYARVMG